MRRNYLLFSIPLLISVAEPAQAGSAIDGHIPASCTPMGAPFEHRIDPRDGVERREIDQPCADEGAANALGCDQYFLRFTVSYPRGREPVVGEPVRFEYAERGEGASRACRDIRALAEKIRNGRASMQERQQFYNMFLRGAVPSHGRGD